MFWDALAGLLNVAGALQTATASSKAATFNQNNALFNAQVATQQGIAEETQVRNDARRQIGQQVANVGASGFDNSGSAADVIAESTYDANLAALTTKYNYQAKVQGYTNQANMYGSAAKSSQIGGYIGAAAAALKSGSNVYKHDSKLDAGTSPFQLGGGSVSGDTE